MIHSNLPTLPDNIKRDHHFVRVMWDFKEERLVPVDKNYVS